MCNHKKIREALKEITAGTGSIKKYCTEGKEFIIIEITKQGATIT